jgi:hypothetical protein|tara:strand:- start:327 stop:785 length:459 start_codon:yes stop_codon:yes gene_type:complete
MVEVEKRSAKQTGMAGELFTAFELAMLDVQCDLVKHDGTDVVAIKGPKVFMSQKIEVKTCTYKNEKNLYCFSISKGGQKSRYTKSDCDILALVSLPQRNIMFYSVGSLSGITKKIHFNTFKNDRDLIKKSWDIALKNSLDESKKMLENYSIE